MKRIIFGLVLVFAVSGVAHAKKALVDKYGVNLLESDTVYTSVNLHPDNNRALLYTVNYQLASLLPRCTPVEITKLSRKKMKFRLKESNLEYTFAYHKRSTPMPLSEYLSDFFTSKCGDADLAKLSDKDREGVRLGRPLVGMSKDGVLFAMGRPPHHVNPTLEHYEWTYWKNKFARTIVTFDNAGKVSQIR